MKKITDEQIQAILQTVYQTNISAILFDQLKKLLLELPVVEIPKQEFKEGIPTED
jgi:hypothetical protein